MSRTQPRREKPFAAPAIMVQPSAITVQPSPPPISASDHGPMMTCTPVSARPVRRRHSLSPPKATHPSASLQQAPSPSLSNLDTGYFTSSPDICRTRKKQSISPGTRMTSIYTQRPLTLSTAQMQRQSEVSSRIDDNIASIRSNSLTPGTLLTRVCSSREDSRGQESRQPPDQQHDTYDAGSVSASVLSKGKPGRFKCLHVCLARLLKRFANGSSTGELLDLW